MRTRLYAMALLPKELSAAVRSFGVDCICVILPATGFFGGKS